MSRTDFYCVMVLLCVIVANQMWDRANSAINNAIRNLNDDKAFKSDMSAAVWMVRFMWFWGAMAVGNVLLLFYHMHKGD